MDIYNNETGIPQSSVLGTIRYTLYSAEIPTTQETTLYTYAGDTGIVALHKHPKTAFSLFKNRIVITRMESTSEY